MNSISEKRKRVLRIISRHADVMTGPQLDKAIDVWDRLVKSEINQPLPVAPNREKGKWAAKSDAINDRNTSETQKPQPKPDARPVNRMHWRVKHPDGRVFSYTMHPNGSMKVSLAGAQQTKTYSLAEWTRIHHDSQDNKKEQPVETITKSQKAEKPRTRWGTMPSLADIATRNEHARTVATPPAKPFVPTDFKSGKMTIHEQQEYRLQQAREKEAARQKKPAVSGASVTACRL